ncbi:MAG: hypothetical protein MUC78_06690 [Bacteroidales bacterium]|jgi:hypothetical protein|nr:hypothetical protein [Bacteroidales bacterium]
MSESNESEVTRLPIPPKFKMEEWYMLSLCGLTPAQMKGLTIHYLDHLRAIALSQAALYGHYIELLNNLESRR